MTRFVLDVFLVIIYGVMLIKYKNFGVVLALLLLVYFIYVVWDGLKIGEYWRAEFKAKKGGCLERFRREWVTVFAFSCVAVISVLFYFFELNRWLVLGLALALSVFYRINKIYPTWERLFGIK